MECPRLLISKHQSQAWKQMDLARHPLIKRILRQRNAGTADKVAVTGYPKDVMGTEPRMKLALPTEAAAVIARAVGVFGDQKKASHWLATPLPLFGDRSPSQLLEGQEGIQLVEQVLTRIEHNIPS